MKTGMDNSKCICMRVVLQSYDICGDKPIVGSIVLYKYISSYVMPLKEVETYCFCRWLSVRLSQNPVHFTARKPFKIFS